jgi:TRAP-type C4-dicarboxylate transport system permease small subunit
MNEDKPRLAGGMVFSGIIAAIVGLVVTYVISLILPFPWTLAQTMICVGIASFSGSAVSFTRGYQVGRVST